MLFSVCLLSRFILAYVLTSIDVRVGATVAGLIGTGLLYLYMTEQRMFARESSTGYTWWHAVRPLHGVLWVTAAVLMVRGNIELARWCLLSDVVVGAVAYLTMKL